MDHIMKWVLLTGCSLYVRYTVGSLYVQTTPNKNDSLLTICLIAFPVDMVCGSLPRHWRTHLAKGSLMPQRMSFWRFVTSQLLEITATLFLCSVLADVIVCFSLQNKTAFIQMSLNTLVTSLLNGHPLLLHISSIPLWNIVLTPEHFSALVLHFCCETPGFSLWIINVV